MADSRLKAHLLFLPWKSTSVLSNTKTTASVQSSCSLSLSKTKTKARVQFLVHVKVQCFGTCRGLLSSLSPHSGSLACSQVLSISGSLLELVCGAHTAHGCMLSDERGHERMGQSITRWARESERLPPGGCGLGHGENRQVHCESQVMSERQRETERDSLLPGIVLARVRGRPGAFSK